MRRFLLSVLFLAGVATASEQTLATFEACWALTKRHFYDPAMHGVDWPAARDRYRPLADAAAPGEELHGVLRLMLGELRASHTAILSPDVHAALQAELRNRRVWTFGALLEESMPGRLFVRASYQGGPTRAVGVLNGDRIIAIDGVDVWKSPHLIAAGYDPRADAPRLFILRAAKDKQLTLRVQTRADAATRIDKVVRASQMNGVDAAEASVRVVRRGGRRLATMHLWYCQRGADRALRAALHGPLRDCEALVLDLRGRGGWVDVTHRILDAVRDFKRPAVFLIDGRTRSAKEMLAHLGRADGLATLVGLRTEGAVLGAGFYELPDGHWLELPISDVKVRGVRLEGRGVAPDHEVDFVVPYSNGRDTVFDKGCAVAVSRLAARRRAIMGASSGNMEEKRWELCDEAMRPSLVLGDLVRLRWRGLAARPGALPLRFAAGRVAR